MQIDTCGTLRHVWLLCLCSNSGPIPSPANMLPSPSPGQVAPSPASRASMGVASPGSALNTPGNPNSVAPSPGSRTDTDEQTYLEKWKQLQKYIEPLKRMINRIDKDEGTNNNRDRLGLLLFESELILLLHH